MMLFFCVRNNQDIDVLKSNDNSVFSNSEEVLDNIVISDTHFSSLNNHALTVSKGASITLENCTIDGTDTFESAIIVENGKLNLVNTTIQNCFSMYGGAINIQKNGLVNLSGTTINNCDAYAGGAIYNRGTLNIENSTISGCTCDFSGQAGGIYNAGILTINDGVVIENNGMIESSGVSYNCSGGGIYNDGTLNMFGGSIRNNFMVPSDGVGYGEGANVYNASGATFNFSGGEILGDGQTIQALQGAGVFNVGTFQMTGGVISNNVVGTFDGSGANVYNAKDAIFNFQNGEISGNGTPQARRGTGVYNLGTFNMSGGDIKNCAVTTELYYEEDSLYRDDGAGASVFNAKYSTYEEIDEDTTIETIHYFGTFNFSGGEIEGLGESVACANYAGAIQNEGECVISGEAQIKNFYVLESGAGIYNHGTLEIKEDAIIDNCHTPYIGGAIYNRKNLTIVDGTISNSSAGKWGGAIFNGDTSLAQDKVAYLKIEGGFFDGNTADVGGAIYNYKNKEEAKHIVDFDGGKISGSSDGDTLNARYGGGILNQGIFNLSGGVIENCFASLYGGGIQNDGTFEFDAGVVQNCQATQYGGGIYNASIMNISKSATIDSCEASEGGGMYNYGTLSMTGGTIQASTAKYGAGIYNRMSLVFSNNALISLCDATERGGGIFNNSYMDPILTGGIISECEAEYFGGGIHNNGGTLTLSGTNISGCGAKSSGGAVCNYATLFITGGIISNCSSNNGGAILNGMNKYFEFSGGNIQNCYANNQGGAIFNQATASTKQCGGSVVACYVKSSSGNGGAVFNDGTYNFYSGDIQGTLVYSTETGKIETLTNIGSSNGAGIYNTTNGLINMYGGTISMCFANNGAGIYNLGKLDIQNANLLNNCARNNGGAIFNDLNANGFSILGSKGEDSRNSVLIDNSLCGVSQASSGAGIYNEVEATQAVDNLTIINCKASYKGGAIYNSNSLSLGSGVEIQNCSASDGGAIFNSSATLNFYGYMFGNTASNYGGAFHNNGGSVNLKNNSKIIGSVDVSIQNAVRGGGIYNFNGSITMEGSAIIQNTKVSQLGGAICNENTDVVVTLSGGEINNCRSGNLGGGIHNQSGELILSGIVIEKCYAQSYGGGISVYRKVNMTAGSINACQTAGYGGGVFNGSAINFVFSGGLITNCYSLRDGGGIFNTGNLFFSGNAKFENNSVPAEPANDYRRGANIFNNESGVVFMAGGTIVGNSNLKATAYLGAGIYNKGNFEISDGSIEKCFSTDGAGIYNDGTLLVTGGLIANCVSSNNGGGIFNKGTFQLDGGMIDNGEMSMSIIEVDGKESVTSTPQAQYGAGIYNDTSGVFNFLSGEILRCVASEKGGGIFNKGTLEMTGGVINNSWLSTTILDENGDHVEIFITQAKLGAGVYNESTFDFDGGIIEECRSSENGAGIANTKTLTINGGIIQNCESSKRGGGVQNDGTFNFVSGQIISCTAKEVGGGVQNSGRMTMDDDSGQDAIIQSCSSEQSGGGINNYGIFTMNDGVISECIASQHGGGISNGYGRSFSIYAGQITGCSADLNGGAIYLPSDGSSRATITIDSSGKFLITDCEAGNWGGAIFLDKNITLSYIESSIINCVATNYGGAIYNGGGVLNISFSDINNCRVEQYNGGCIFNAGSLVFEKDSRINNSELSDDQSLSGSGIYNTGNLTINNSTIFGCRATSFGGAIYNENSMTFDGKIEECYSSNLGGGIYNQGSLKLNGGEIVNCGADNAGGGVYNSLGSTNFEFYNNISMCYASIGGSIASESQIKMGSGANTDNLIALGTKSEYKINATSQSTGRISVLSVLSGLSQDEKFVVDFYGFDGDNIVSDRHAMLTHYAKHYYWKDENDITQGSASKNLLESSSSIENYDSQLDKFEFADSGHKFYAYIDGSRYVYHERTLSVGNSGYIDVMVNGSYRADNMVNSTVSVPGPVDHTLYISLDDQKSIRIWDYDVEWINTSFSDRADIPPGLCTWSIDDIGLCNNLSYTSSLQICGNKVIVNTYVTTDYVYWTSKSFEVGIFDWETTNIELDISCNIMT